MFELMLSSKNSLNPLKIPNFYWNRILIIQKKHISKYFWIFDPDEFHANLNSWVKSAFKIIQNDTKIAYEHQNFPIENGHFNFCVGKNVDEKSAEFSGVFSTDSLQHIQNKEILFKIIR